MNLKPPNPIPSRHPGGRTCAGALPTAIVLTAVAMWRHRSELRELVKGE